MDEIIEQLLGNVINGQQVNSKEVKELFSQLQEEIRAIKNKESDTQAVEELKRLIIQQTSEIEMLKTKEISIDSTTLANLKPIKKTIIFGGNDAFVTYKWALGIIAFVICFFFASKYIPSYLIESKAAEVNTVINSKFTTFLRLKQFKEHGNTKKIDAFLTKIEYSDSIFSSEYNSLLRFYKKELERVETENTIKELQNKLEETKK